MNLRIESKDVTVDSELESFARTSLEFCGWWGGAVKIQRARLVLEATPSGRHARCTLGVGLVEGDELTVGAVGPGIHEAIQQACDILEAEISRVVREADLRRRARWAARTARRNRASGSRRIEGPGAMPPGGQRARVA